MEHASKDTRKVLTPGHAGGILAGMGQPHDSVPPDICPKVVCDALYHLQLGTEVHDVQFIESSRFSDPDPRPGHNAQHKRLQIRTIAQPYDAGVPSA